jgi:hypothetical protein
MAEVKKVTKAWWEELEGKPKWDIQVALRGPDCHNSEGIKWFTTSVIRGMMSKAIRTGGTVNTDLKLVIIPVQTDYSKRLPKSDWNYEHFFEHVATAAHWLGLPLLAVPFEEWWEIRNSPASAQGMWFLTTFNKEQRETDAVKELARHMEATFPHYTTKKGGSIG